MFGKLMSIPDDLMPEYYRLLLSSEVPKGDPNQAKRELGRRIVERFYDGGAAEGAEEHFDRLHVRHEPPEEVEEVSVPANGPHHLPALLADHFGVSRSEARRLIDQGGVKIDGRVVDGDQLDVAAEELDGAILQVGKRRHKRVRIG
jgi:tyrosyl-tRNA synthetase